MAGNSLRVARIDAEMLQTAVAAAVRAPSLHNSQPWRFRLRGDRVEVLADAERRLPSADPSGWGVRIACGAATYNLRLALAIMQVPVEVTWRPDLADEALMARLVPAAPRPPTPVEERLHDAIPRRHSNRTPYWPQPVPADVRTHLIEAARSESAWLELVTGMVPVSLVAEIAQAANRVLNRDENYRTELAAWTRSADDSLDGVPASAAGPSPEPQDLLPQRPFGTSERAPGRDYEPEPLVGILGTAGDLPIDQLAAGHALQRVLLTITDLGLAASMLSQPIEVPAAREQLRIALGRHSAPQMVLRIGYGQHGAVTARRPPAEVIDD